MNTEKACETCGAVFVAAGWMTRRGFGRFCSRQCSGTFNATTHGKRKTRAYCIWAGIRQRCGNQNQKCFKNYGGRGITLFPAWVEFAVFYAHLLTILPDGATDVPDGLTVDRADNEKGYEPGNLRLRTNREQCRNKRNNRMLTVRGQTRCVTEWAEVTGLGRLVITKRLIKGWDAERAVTQGATKFPECGPTER